MDPTSNSDKASKPEVVIDSSYVRGYTYNEQTYELIVFYRSGAVFQYFNVLPPAFSQMFDFSDSVGKAVRTGLKANRHIKLR